MMVALRIGCWRRASAAARTMKSLRLGTATPRAAYCSFISARSATTASMHTSKPCVSCAISVRLCCMRAAIVPRIPFIGMIDAVSWPAGRLTTPGVVATAAAAARLRRRGGGGLDVAAPDDAVTGGDAGRVDARIAGVSAGQRRDDLAGLTGARGLRAACGRLLDVLRDDAATRAGPDDRGEVDVRAPAATRRALGLMNTRPPADATSTSSAPCIVVMTTTSSTATASGGSRRSAGRCRPRPRRAASRAPSPGRASCRPARRGPGCRHPPPRRPRRSCPWPVGAAACRP